MEGRRKRKSSGNREERKMKQEEEEVDRPFNDWLVLPSIVSDAEKESELGFFTGPLQVPLSLYFLLCEKFLCVIN